MVKELSQAREDHLNNFLSAGNSQPHSTAWGAQDLSKDRDDAGSEDTWSSNSEKAECWCCYRMPYWTRKRPSINQNDEHDMTTCLVGSDELAREHELQES